MDRDSNILLAVIASRLHQSQWKSISEVLQAWQSNPSTSMGDQLMAASVLTEGEKDAVAELVRRAVEAHGGDSAAALAAYGGGDALGASPHVFCLQGKTLGEALAECKTLDERLRLLPQYASLCDAVGAGHSRGIIHRGLNPGIALLTDYGETVVSDWSLSITRGREDLQRERVARLATDESTRPYLAPEIVQGGLDEVDARSDVYALGAILYHLLTGKPPAAHGADIQPADAVQPGVPSELAKICRRAMFGEASARYANASQLGESVRQYDVQPAQSPAAAGVDPLYKTLLGAAVVCLVVLAGALGFVYYSLSAERKEAVAVRDEETDARRNIEEQRDQLAEKLKEAEAVRKRVERDRDNYEDALNLAKSDLQKVRAEAKAVKAELLETSGALERAETAAQLAEQVAEEAEAAEPVPTPAPREQAAVREARRAPAAVEEPPPVEEDPEPASPPAAEEVLAAAEELRGGEVVEEPVEPFSTPLPDVELVAQQEDAAAQTAQAGAAAALTAAAEPAITPEPPPPPPVRKTEFADAMPDLIAAVVSAKEEVAASRAALRITDPTAAAVKAMGFKDGDIITRINREPIRTVEDARRALVNVQNDSGFSIRIMRNGQAGWMRINFTKPAQN